ncbi:homoserine dehydrogenase [Paludicola sp. MB14-C6]|uniref:homoserine dehydrogenase n=1 Tax=Paludihabitans sp. MB14-C6 TaxID=3070656 RepID=UPI0027DE42B6|nr:homoserine dehydrogenase [Paludicola sp. MB14-C6]WMJ23620.1 homoserine dehydrogenase [Paludicola sp. MB14-C6]
MAKIAVLGHGVVGSGVVEVIESNKESIKRRAGQEIEVKRILDLRDFSDLSYSHKFTKNFDDILNDDEITVVVEVMGGINPAFDFAKASLQKGKSVVTSNKELVAGCGAELLKIAKENNVNFFFEASVGGGIPIIRPMHQCLAANEINEIAGILNGTTNFILTKMIKEQMDFDTALKLAQDLGYAERNPSADVDGHDACRKICILASLAFGRHVHPDNVQTEGITKITLEDVDYAENWGGVIKLIARAKRGNNGKIECMVSPAFVPKSSQLANIDDVFNGVLIRGNATGDVVFYGKGAGKLPTASAVVADVIDVAKAVSTSKSLTWDECEENIVESYKNTSSAFYVRVETNEPTEAKVAISREFGDVIYLSRKEQPKKELAFVTKSILEKDMLHKLTALVEDDILILTHIRLVDY